jgi:DNA-binding NarL/FixJ family response regulator
LEVARALKRRQPHAGVIILTMHQDDEQLFNAIRAGASAYCTKDIEPEQLIDVITRVARGEYLINEMVLSRPFVASRVLDQFRELSRLDRTSSGVFSPLTPREIEILDCVARGYSNKEIAQALNISDQTVKNHITSILRKLAVNDRTQAVIYALRHGWIKLEDTEDGLPGPAPSFGRERGTTLAPAELPLQFLGAQMNHRRAPMRAGVGDAALLELANEFAHLGKREFLSRPDR